MPDRQQENLAAAAWVFTVAILVLATLGAVMGLAA